MEDEERTYYCKDCLSLNVRLIRSVNIEYCGDCNSCHIDSVATYEDYEKLKEKKYPNKRKRNGR